GRHRRCRALRVLLAEFSHSGARAVFVLLRGAAADAAGAVDHAVADDGKGALARDHVSAFGGGDALDDRASRALGQLTAGTREGGRGDRLALRTVGAGPQRAVHAIEGDQASAGVAHRHADPDVALLGFGQRPLHDLIGFRERQHLSSLGYIVSVSRAYSAVVPPSITSSLPVT